MALQYRTPDTLQSLLPILDEHVVWYGKIVRGYFEKRPCTDPFPTSFQDWVKVREEKHDIMDASIHKLSLIYDELLAAARLFIAKSALALDEAPLKEYNELTRYYEEFIQSLRRLEQDQLLENSGYDDRTGLRSIRVMQADVDIEMQRVARNGNPFCLAYLRVNAFPENWRGDWDSSREMVLKLSSCIMETLRVYDDAYYLENEFFVLLLKQADTIGGEVAVGRLSRCVKEKGLMLDESTPLTLSAVVYEPAPNEQVDAVLVNMRNDLMGIAQKAAVVKFNDLSPLQRFVQNQEKSAGDAT